MPKVKIDGKIKKFPYTKSGKIAAKNMIKKSKAMGKEAMMMDEEEMEEMKEGMPGGMMKNKEMKAKRKKMIGKKDVGISDMEMGELSKRYKANRMKSKKSHYGKY